MKKILLLLSIFAGTFFAGTPCVFGENPREALWENALCVSEEKPKTALDAFDAIIKQATEAQAWEELVLATILRARSLAQIEGRDGGISAIRALDKASAGTSNLAARAFLDAQLARSISSYARERKFGSTIQAQTPIAKNTEKNVPAARVPAEIETFSSEELLALADTIYQRVFASAGTLKKIPLAAFLGKSPDSATLKKQLRDLGINAKFGIIDLKDSSPAEFPTLFDFFAQDAIKFYEEIKAPKARLLEIFQAWVAFHRADAEKSAFARAKFTRLEWEFRTAKDDENTSENFKTALKKFSEDFAYFPIAAEADAALAQCLLDEGDSAQAHRIASESYKKHQAKPNAAKLGQILKGLEEQTIELETSGRVWANQDSAMLKIWAKNISKIHFRAVRWDWNDFLRRERNRPENLSAREKKEILLSNENAIEWSQTLDTHGDFKKHNYDVPAPFEKLKPGFYFIVASAQEDFSLKERESCYVSVWVSNLAIIYEQPRGKNTFSGRVVHTLTGEPLEGVSVSAWNRAFSGARVAVPAVKTDSDGKFSISGVKNGFIALASTEDGNAVDTKMQSFFPAQRPQKSSKDADFIFTDRAIYRPGQTIHFKGILASRDPNEPDSGRVIPGEKVTISLHDSNNRLIEKTECYSNAFGSFAGTFTAPANALTGSYKIKFKSVARYFSIEEYKRPKFFAAIESPQDELILGRDAHFTVAGTAFTGTPLAGAKVEWKISESPRWSEKETHFDNSGTGTLDENGKLKITFPTKIQKLSRSNAQQLSAEKRLENERQLTRDYTISATITDATGETQTEIRTICIGNSALVARVRQINENALTPESIPTLAVDTSTHNFVEKSVPVKIEVFEVEKIETSQTGTFGRQFDNRSGEEKFLRGKKVFEQTEKTSGNAVAPKKIGLKKLPAGDYLVAISGKDSFGKPFFAETRFRVIEPAATRYAGKEFFFLEKETPIAEIGKDFVFYWGSSFESARAYIEISQENKPLQAFWTAAGNTQQAIRVPVSEAQTEGIKIRVSQIRNNRLYQEAINVPVKAPSQTLKIVWEKFRTKLVPGGAEVWTAKITDENGVPAKAEMVATLYDKSLDLFRRNWLPHFEQNDSFEFTRLQRLFSSGTDNLNSGRARYKTPYSYNFFDQISWTLQVPRQRPQARTLMAYSTAAVDISWEASSRANRADAGDNSGMQENVPAKTPEPLPFIATRKNLQETAFFYPFLNTDSAGTVKLSFVVPEALTGWRFLAFAHDAKLRAGTLDADNIITSKDLIVQPNAPRFLREGDALFFPVKIVNSSADEISGEAKLTFANLETGTDMSAQLGIKNAQKFNLRAGESKTLFWEIRVPDGCPFLSFRATATAGTLADGEENFLPVLSRKITITESLNVPVRGNTTKSILFEKLANQAAGTFTGTSHALTFQTVSDPIWTAILALPYMAEACDREGASSSSIFFRYYTNALGQKIANSDPKIRATFERWRTTPIIESPLAKNAQIKQIALEETPYWQAAQDEAAQRRAVGNFFNENKIEIEKTRALEELRKRLDATGGLGWSWFPGRTEISQHVTRNLLIGFARLRDMGIETDLSLALRAVPAQDAALHALFNRFKDDGTHVPASLNSTIAAHLYMRSFYAKEVPQGHKDAWEHYLSVAKNPKNWLQLSRMSQAHIALALHRLGGDENRAVAKRIAESIREHATQSEELGAFWKDDRALPLWCWNYLPIETQAMMIELFERVASDNAFAEEIRINLLTQKQTHIWESSYATADAIWALLLGKMNVPAKTEAPAETKNLPLEITAGTQKILATGTQADNAGTFEKTFLGKEIVPALGKISVKNPNAGIAWVSAHWTFSQAIDEVAAHAQSAMKIRKTLWKKTLDRHGKPALFPVRGEVLLPGDELVVRLTIETDRDFEFLHMKDYRGSGTEPTHTLSRWNCNPKHWIWYYEMPRDTATHFFFESLPAGTHVFEYSLRIQQRGKYTGGITELRSLYAPEFNAHSATTNISTR